MNPVILQSLSLFGAGVLTSLTPCVYPMIPITVGYLGSNSSSTYKKLKVIGFFLGQVMAFTTLGVVAVSLGEILGFSSELPAIQIGTGVILLFFTYYSYKGALPNFLTKWNSTGFLNKQTAWSQSPFVTFLQALFVGAVSALVASPCTSPVLGGVLTAIAQAPNPLTGIGLMFLYSLGMSLIFLVLGLGLVNMSKLPKSGKWLGLVHKISTVMLGLGAGYFFAKGFGYL